MKEKENHLETLKFHPLKSTKPSNRRTNPPKEEDVMQQSAAKYATHLPLREANELSQRDKKCHTAEILSAPILSQGGSYLPTKLTPHRDQTGMK